MRKGLWIVLLLMSVGCRPTVLQEPFGLGYTIPQGTPDYKLGYEDGCDTGISAQDSGYLQRAAFGYKKRTEMWDNPEYKEGWNDGFQYCRFTKAAQDGK